jgi:hypothetical protein
MKKTRVKKTKKVSERKIDMAEHDYRVKALGMSERAARTLIRVLIFLVPLIIVIAWFIKAVK